MHLVGGYPGGGRDGRTGLDRGAWWGPGKLGTWAIDPASGKFQHLTDDGPAGYTKAVYDSAHDLIVALPQKAKGGQRTTWVFSASSGKWEARSSSSLPRPSPNAAWAYDSKVKKCVFFDGYGETWTYDAGSNTWAKMDGSPSPTPRRHAAMTFDASRGVTVLHGGLTNPETAAMYDARLFEAGFKSVALTDTWAYDAAKNQWRELKPSASPPKTFSGRDLAAYDHDRKMSVFYDVAVGVWGLRSNGSGPGSGKRSGALPVAKPKAPPAAPILDDKAKAWQEKLRAMPDNSWLDTGIVLPPRGCMNFSYDPKNHCLVQFGGCQGATWALQEDDVSYFNSGWILDMDVARFYLRRAHHPYGPNTPEYKQSRTGAGCSRGACFDSKRGVIWNIGGNGWSSNGTVNILSYDIAADKFGTAGPLSPRGHDGEPDMLIYDAKSDHVVLADTRKSNKTLLFNPTTKSWTDGGPCPITEYATSLIGYCHRAYDPKLGVIMTLSTAKNWEVGDPWKDGQPMAIRTFAYDASAKKWRDLKPAGAEKVPVCNKPGIAYDSRNRAILFAKHDHGGTSSRSPGVPAGSIWILDLEANEWKAVSKAAGADTFSVVYDANHNVFLFAAYGHTVTLYRHKGGFPSDGFSK